MKQPASTLVPLLLLAAGALTLMAQEPPAAIAPPQTDIQVNVNLIQIDVTVMDKQGKRIPSLTAADFEILQDGRKQAITGVTWVGRRPSSAAAPATPSATPTPGIPLPARQLTKQQVRRTVAILVDDLSLGPASLLYTREAVRKFIDANVEEGDLLALFRTSAGMSFLQQFTSDRRQLMDALGRTSFRNMNQVDSLAAMTENPDENSGDPTIAEMAMRERLRDEVNRRERQDMITAGMLGSMKYLVQGLREMPGRKSIILFSESVQLSDAPQSMFNPDMSRDMAMAPGAQGGSRYRTRDALRELTDQANRAGVVLYAIDPRGLQTLDLTAQDAPPSNPRRAIGAMNQRIYEFTASQAGMEVMAQETGGLFFKGTNDITAALRDAVDDQEDYYLVAYQPDDATFEKVKSALSFHRIEIKIKRPGLRVRYRKGFLGLPDSPERRPPPVAPLLAAMSSPFRAADVPLRLTPLIRQVEVDDGKKKGGSAQQTMVRALLHLDAGKFTFQDQAADAADTNQTPWKLAKIELAIFLFDQESRVAARSTHAQQIRLRGRTLENAMRDGIVQQLDLTVPKPGSYQLRAAVLDQATGLAGSAVQFLQVPDLSKRPLASSDLVLSAESWEKGEEDHGSPARRLFSVGDKLNYTMVIYNARISPEAKTPKLETQMILYRNGKPVFRGPKNPLEPKDHKPNGNLNLTGTFTLGKTSAPGDYALEIAVRDTLAPRKQQYTVRMMDFEVRR